MQFTKWQPAQQTNQIARIIQVAMTNRIFFLVKEHSSLQRSVRCAVLAKPQESYSTYQRDQAIA